MRQQEEKQPVKDRRLTEWRWFHLAGYSRLNRWPPAIWLIADKSHRIRVRSTGRQCAATWQILRLMEGQCDYTYVRRIWSSNNVNYMRCKNRCWAKINYWFRKRFRNKSNYRVGVRLRIVFGEIFRKVKLETYYPMSSKNLRVENYLLV